MRDQLSWRIIKKFALKNSYSFSFGEVVKEYPEKSPAYLGTLLGDMVEQGMLCKISRNNYHIIPLNADPRTYAPDGFQVAKNIMQDNEYYLGYASALKIHGLSYQSKTAGSTNEEFKEKEPLDPVTEEIVYVVTKKQMRPAIRNVGGIRFQIIHHNATRFFGFENIWINNLEKATVSDMERTIVDVATQPQFCGGIIELGQGIYRAEGKVDRDKLFNYFARNLNKAAKKRFLFLTDLLGLQWSVEHERMLKELGSGINLLDPSAPDQGRSRVKFGLKINVDPYQIRETIAGRRID